MWALDHTRTHALIHFMAACELIRNHHVGLILNLNFVRTFKKKNVLAIKESFQIPHCVFVTAS